MNRFDYVRPATRRRGDRGRRRAGRGLSRRRHQPARPDEGRRRRARRAWSTSRACRGSTASSSWPMAACASARWCATPTSPTTRTSRDAIPRSRRRCCRAPRRSCATPRPSAAICCSGRAAPISTTPPAPATSASPAPAAMRAAARTACTRCSAGASTASPPIRPISACRSWRSTPWSRSRAGPAGARSPLEALHRLPGDDAGAGDACWSRAS